MRKDYTDVTVVLDRSGSMESIRKDMEGGFAAFVAKQQGLLGTCLVTMVQFDSTATEIRYTGVPIAKVGPLELVPRGSTPLLDATAFAIRSTGERLAALPEAERPGNVLVLIVTDGHENASRETSAAALRKMIEHQRSDYHWDFVYLGANVDAFAEARQMGIPRTHSVDYDANTEGVDASWVVLGGKFGVYHGGDKKALEFTPYERDRMKRA